MEPSNQHISTDPNHQLVQQLLAPLSSEALRIRGLYFEISSDNLFDSLTSIFLYSDDNLIAARLKSASVLHIQGKERFVGGGRMADLTAIPTEELKDNYLDQNYQNLIITVLKRFIVHNLKVTGGESRIKVLIIYLSVRNLFYLLHELDLPEQYMVYLNNITDYVVREKSLVLDGFIKDLKKSGNLKLAERVSEKRFEVLELQAGDAIHRYFSDIEDESFNYSSELMTLLINARSKYLNLTGSKKVWMYCQLVDNYSESSYSKIKKQVDKDLINFATDEEIFSINHLLLEL